jgi:hypothetical protein
VGRCRRSICVCSRKAKVEVAVQVAQRWIVARLRDETFFSLDRLNARARRQLLLPNVLPHPGMLPHCLIRFVPAASIVSPLLRVPTPERSETQMVCPDALRAGGLDGAPREGAQRPNGGWRARPLEDDRSGCLRNGDRLVGRPVGPLDL